MTHMPSHAPPMTESISPTQSQSGPNWLQRAARRTVLTRLSTVRSGVIDICDQGGVHRFGRMDASQPHQLKASLIVHDDRFWSKVVLGGSLGAAEAYLRGWWTCDDLTSLLRIFVRDMQTADRLDHGWAKTAQLMAQVLHWFRRNTRAGSRRNISEHYDLGNEFFELMLDESMMYSCAWFTSHDTSLKDAQFAKIDRLCRGLKIKAGDCVLEIGTGWGTCAIHAAQAYGCHVTSATISKQQFEYASHRVKAAGLQDRIKVVMSDYRDLEGSFDHIISIEMIEAVGHEYLSTYFEKCASLLKPGGRMALQVITMPDDRYQAYRSASDFIQRYVFPGSCCPSMGAMSEAMSGALRVVHIDRIGKHYAHTLRLWRKRFTDRLDDVRRMGFPERFIRLWMYYLCYCEAGFAEGYIDDLQMMLAHAKPHSDS